MVNYFLIFLFGFLLYISNAQRIKGIIDELLLVQCHMLLHYLCAWFMLFINISLDLVFLELYTLQHVFASFVIFQCAESIIVLCSFRAA